MIKLAQLGTVKPPPKLSGFVQQGGGGGISALLTSLVSLILLISSLALIFMFLWGAFNWITSGGDKEKVASAQRTITHAVIGIVILGVAFAVLAILQTFLGFTLFK